MRLIASSSDAEHELDWVVAHSLAKTLRDAQEVATIFEIIGTALAPYPYVPLHFDDDDNDDGAMLSSWADPKWRSLLAAVLAGDKADWYSNRAVLVPVATDFTSELSAVLNHLVWELWRGSWPSQLRRAVRDLGVVAIQVGDAGTWLFACEQVAKVRELQLAPVLSFQQLQRDGLFLCAAV